MKRPADPFIALNGHRTRYWQAGAESEVLDRCGHVPMLERTADFNRLTLEFIDRHD